MQQNCCFAQGRAAVGSLSRKSGIRANEKNDQLNQRWRYGNIS